VNKMFKKGYLQISFAWLFAIIAGIFILFLAIFMATKIIQTEQTAQSAKVGKEIGILLNPLETSFETGKVNSLLMPVETRIYSECNNKGNFGNQIIRISQKSFKEWTDTDINVYFENKYIFSDNPVEGREFYLFSKPFEFPFKVSDLIYITSSLKKYCFANAPEEIKEELLALKQQNIIVGDCVKPEELIMVCFGGAECEINVNYNLKYVEKNNEKMYFEEDALMYAAIFSNKELYECQLKRLMQRVSVLTSLYRDKSTFLSQRTECSSNLNLLELKNLASNFDSSISLERIYDITNDIKNKNDLAACKLW